MGGKKGGEKRKKRRMRGKKRGEKNGGKEEAGVGEEAWFSLYNKSLATSQTLSGEA